MQYDIRDLLTAPGDADTELAEFYAARADRPVWSGSAVARRRAATAMHVLARAYQQGLPQAAYDFTDRLGQSELRQAASADLELTQLLLAYVHDVRQGRLSPPAVYRDLRLPRRHFQPALALIKALARSDLKGFLRRLPPRAAQYQALVRALAHYRKIAAAGGWITLGEHPSHAQLAARLALEDPTLARLSHPSGSALAEALRRFQARHGLKPDAVLGVQTKQALNVPVQERISEIKANLERWRWLPRHFPDRYILVNVPSQRAALIEHGRTKLLSKVVIGRNQKGDTTPILLTDSDAIVANPVWTIPNDIATSGILPYLRRDPNYLKSRHMVLAGAPPHTRVDWAKIRAMHLPYQIIQLPGPGNALGNIMFDMPNHFDVYLHGTSDPVLFDLANRARSHGCVRVQKISELADLALEGSVSDPAQALRLALATGKTQRLLLAHPLPIYLLYWTAQVEADGMVAFWPDRYDRDPALLALLEPPSRLVIGPKAPPTWFLGGPRTR
jgi:murein L,D-transpeptidase YcbB/YkuD